MSKSPGMSGFRTISADIPSPSTRSGEPIVRFQHPEPFMKSDFSLEGVCSLCGVSRSAESLFKGSEFKMHDKVICECCISRLTSEANSVLQEELDVKDQINLNLKKGLEEQLRVISRCKQFILALEEIVSYQGLWKSVCEIESQEHVQNLLYESHAGIQKWNQKSRQLELENSSLRSQLSQQKLNISILESNLQALQEDYNHSRSTIESLRRVKLEKDSLKSIASETSSLMEKFRLENDGLKVRCFRLEQRVKELTNNYESEFPLVETERLSRRHSQIRTLSWGIQDNYHHSILENSSVVFNNYQLVNCVERLISYCGSLFPCFPQDDREFTNRS
ncbi:FYVE zinc finger domain-containing protein [Cryptosporidium felis]|nr:FYVE zinc finger domain-containing protein [Cryptosporidium felis]